MSENPLRSLAEYSRFVAELVNRDTVQRSTIRIWSDSSHTGIAEGEIFFHGNIRLRVREELDFEAVLITSYGYEVYRGEERLFWYDDFPHPHVPELASTFPHHKHVPPDPKRNRVPASHVNFNCANLPALISEVESLLNTSG